MSRKTGRKPRVRKIAHRPWWQRTALVLLGLGIFAYALIWVAPDTFVWFGWPFAQIAHPMLFYPAWARFTAALGFGAGSILLMAIGWLI